MAVNPHDRVDDKEGLPNIGECNLLLTRLSKTYHIYDKKTFYNKQIQGVKLVIKCKVVIKCKLFCCCAMTHLKQGTPAHGTANGDSGNPFLETEPANACAVVGGESKH
jgi:hypothetical protein